jgi:hypothetical protein
VKIALQARAFDVPDEEDPTESAARCAVAIIEHLSRGDQVVLDVNDLRGASSTYFNTLFLTVLDAVSSHELGWLSVESTSALLREVIRRSREAALARVTSREASRGSG